MPEESQALRPSAHGHPTYDAASLTESGSGEAPCFGAVDDQGENGVALTAGLILADVLGAGILSSAVAISQLGWLVGTVVVIVLLTMNMHISLLMWRVRMRCPHAHTYTGLVDAAFSSRSGPSRRAAVLCTGLSQYSSLLGVLILYTLTIGKSLGMVFYDVHICLPKWTLFGCIVLLPFLASSRSLGTWQSLIWINIVTILGTVLPALVEMATTSAQIGASNAHVVAPVSFGNYLAGVSTICFAFSSQFMVVEIMSEMKEPSKFPRAYGVSAPFQGVVVLVCGVGGYYLLGDRTTGMIIDSIPFNLNLQIVAACLLFHMLVTYMLKGTVFCRAVHTFIARTGANDASLAGWATWTVIVTVVLASTWVIAQVVPFFAVLVELIGGTCTPLCCIVIPIVTYVQWLRSFGEQSDMPSKIEWVAMAIELALAAVLMVALPIISSDRIAHDWHRYGEPFSCHCEGLWNSCACSSSRPGMEQCSAGSSGGF